MDILEIISNFFESIDRILSSWYRRGYMMYFVIGVIGLVIYLIYKRLFG